MNYITKSTLFLVGTLFLCTSQSALCFVSQSSSSTSIQRSIHNVPMMINMHSSSSSSDEDTSRSSLSSSRRSFFTSLTSAFLVTNSILTSPQSALAEEDNNEPQPTAQAPLYFILRVKEATEQETRLIKSGKFKDVQRANVKLAVKFMLDNYRLNDNFIAASAFLNGDRKIKGVEIGQTTVQNLQTILEYFDSSDVENIKIGSTGLGGKETIVLNGLTAARKSIDDFVSLFPKEDVAAVIAKIEAENELNRQEFDSDLGSILNPKPAAQP